MMSSTAAPRGYSHIFPSPDQRVWEASMADVLRLMYRLRRAALPIGVVVLVLFVAYIVTMHTFGVHYNASTVWVGIGLFAGICAGLAFFRESLLSSKGVLARACFALVGIILIIEASVLLRAALR